jgi:hypothetical protein
MKSLAGTSFPFVKLAMKTTAAQAQQDVQYITRQDGYKQVD